MAPGHTVEAFHAHDHAQVRLGDENHYYLSSLASALPHVPPSPSAVIPFRRDRDFVHRSIVDELWHRASQPGARVGLVGLGGTGKSQLAIENAYRVRERLPQTWVFWVHASSVTRFHDSYRQIAERLQLGEWDDPKMDVLGSVHTWLSDESHGNWMMIVDNADNAEVLFASDEGEANTTSTTGASARSCSHYLPVSLNGSIIITSRVREVVEGLDVLGDDILEVGPMEMEVAERLLINKLTTAGGETAHKQRCQLVRELDGIALAITQAAAYINQRAPRMTVGRYVEMLRQSDGDRTKLLEKGVRDPRRDRQASNAIITTWHISFKHLRQTHGSAARLLALMSMFHREAIPDHLLQGHYMEDPAQSVDLEDDVATLRSYGLIHMGVDEHVFDMHRLVQLSTKAWLLQQGELAPWQGRYVRILGQAFPMGGHTNWAVCKALFPHVDVMKSYNVTEVDVRQTWASVLYKGAWYARDIGQYSTARQMAELSLDVQEQATSRDEVITLDSIDLLGTVLRDQGKYEQAEEMNRRALAGREQALGADHPDTLTSVSNLALVLQYQGKYDQAEELNRRALAGSEQVLGADHPDTLTSVGNMAGALQYQGKYNQAEEMNRQALAGREQVLGADHPDTLTSVSNLAGALQYQGKYDQAEEMNRRALAGREQVLGADHPDTLTSVSNLALVLQYQGKYEQAEELNRRALAGREQALGADHPDTLTSVGNLALVLQYQGKYRQAEEMNRRALAEREQALRADHPLTLTSVSNLALVLQYQGKYDQAEEMNRRALAGREQALGADHPSTLTSVSNLAGVLQYQGKYDQAEEMNRRALAGREQVLGADHPSMLTSVSNLALVLQYQGKYDQAEEMNRRALAGREQVLGADHPDTLTSVSNLAGALQYQGKYDQAEEMNRRALAGREQALGADHPDTLTSVYCLASLLDARQDHPLALELYDRAVLGFRRMFGDSHSTTRACQQHQALLQRRMRRDYRADHVL